MKELLEALARELVDQPESVFVEEVPEDGTTVLELDVAPEDRGLVIGRRGRTVDALRVLLDAVARRHGAQCDVRVLD